MFQFDLYLKIVLTIRIFHPYFAIQAIIQGFYFNFFIEWDFSTKNYKPCLPVQQYCPRWQQISVSLIEYVGPSL